MLSRSRQFWADFRQRVATTDFFGHLLTLAALLPLITVGFITITIFQDGLRRWLTLLLLLLFSVPLIALVYLIKTTRAQHIALASETLIVLALVAVEADTSLFQFILFAVIAAQASIALPPRQATIWMGILMTITLVVSLLIGGLPALVVGTGNFAGYLFFGLVGGLMRQAQVARARSEELLAELRAAHEQLRDYALQSQQLAIVEERNRLAREIHDSIGHRLTVAIVQLEGAQRLIPTDPQRAARIAGTIREQMKEALGELRRSISALRAPVEGDLSLTEALRRLAQAFAEGTGIRVEISLPPELPALPAAYRMALFSTAQEALTNVQRHAQAEQAWLQMQIDETTISLTVADNGTGFEQTLSAQSGGFGLTGLRERAEQLGGRLQIESHPGSGAQLQLKLPLPVEIPAGSGAVPA